MANAWTVNEHVVKDFEEYAPRHREAEPPYAEKSCLSETEIAVWPNRVPEHEPWARVLKQDKDDTVDIENDGYKDNVDAIDQYTNEGDDGRKHIGIVEGDETTKRGIFWRR